MTPRQFLLLGGIILVVLGLAGMFVLGPTAASSLLGEFFWLDSTENIIHLLLGAIALAAYYLVKDDNLVKWLVVLVGVLATLATVVGLLNAGNAVPNVGVANLENPSDTILHLVVAVWALWVGLVSKQTA